MKIDAPVAPERRTARDAIQRLAEVGAIPCEARIPDDRGCGWAESDGWVIGAAVDPHDWPAWTDHVTFGATKAEDG